MISEVYADYLAKSNLTIERSKDIKNKITLLESDIAFFNKIENSLACQKDVISRMMQSISPFMTEESLTSVELEHLRNRYTMEIERGIHKRALREDNSQKYETQDPQSEKTDSKKEDGTDYIADNVELF